MAELLSNAERHPAGSWRLVTRHSTRLPSIAVHDPGCPLPPPGKTAFDGTGQFSARMERLPRGGSPSQRWHAATGCPPRADRAGL
ncbi:hypothetical protein [Streptomyces sp. CLI2509]|uniref:hypothetical protein n=1 Tax=Streptomyces sp. CLI2509 TaxID=1984801 RepID=UPI000BAC5C51|nr:hypothetical protein [Streptomyces sp. CLI2509]ASY31784.1 hypothetical protein CAC01_03025 [Streptomyces sp. CLI2509]